MPVNEIASGAHRDDEHDQSQHDSPHGTDPAKPAECPLADRAPKRLIAPFQAGHGATGPNYLKADFTTLMNYVAASGARVLSTGDVWRLGT